MPFYLRRIVFLGLASFIVISPFFPQVLKVGSPWIRPWTMYAGVGSGLLKGDFTLQFENGRVETLSPLKVLGLERYPDTFHYKFEGRVMSREEIAALGARYCASHGDIRSLTFSGRVGIRQGWARYETEDLCAKTESTNV